MFVYLLERRPAVGWPQMFRDLAVSGEPSRIVFLGRITGQVERPTPEAGMLSTFVEDSIAILYAWILTTSGIGSTGIQVPRRCLQDDVQTRPNLQWLEYSALPPKVENTTGGNDRHNPQNGYDDGA